MSGTLIPSPTTGRLHIDVTGTTDLYPTDGAGGSSASAANEILTAMAAAIPNGGDLLVEDLEFLAGPTTGAAETLTITELDARGMATTHTTPYFPLSGVTTDGIRRIGKVYRSGFKASFSGAVGKVRIYFRIIKKVGPPV